jgi:hypothetical protein
MNLPFGGVETFVISIPIFFFIEHILNAMIHFLGQILGNLRRAINYLFLCKSVGNIRKKGVPNANLMVIGQFLNNFTGRVVTSTLLVRADCVDNYIKYFDVRP